MTKEDLAAQIDGREYGAELTEEESAQAKANGLVVVFGASDDLMEFRGAIYDEQGVYDGGTALIDGSGLLPEREQIEDDATLEDWVERRKTAKTIEALWAEEGDYSWTYKTSIPHATFEIVEGDDAYCRGIVFALTEVHPPATA